MKTYLFSVLCCTLFLVNCADSKVNPDSECWSFDVRQCGTDQYNHILISNDTNEGKELRMKNWLEENGASVANVKYVPNFHTSVCEACYNCPSGDRFYVQFINDNLPDAEALELLNFEQNDAIDCI